MILASAMKKGLVASTLAAGILSAAAPAEAQSLRLLPGLMGGLAIAAIAASAHAAQQQESTLYILAPADEGPTYWVDSPSAVSAPRQPARRILRARPRAEARSTAAVRGKVPAAPVAQVESGAVERCKASLAANSRALGSVAVNVREAGPGAKARNGSVDVPVVARIEYARNGRKQVRQARVTCRLNPEGQVVAFR